MDLSEGEKQWLEDHRKEREQLFGNEAFAIGVTQAVSGGAVVAALSQATTMVQLVGSVALASFFNLSGLALLAAVMAAYFRHQYKLWDVKARVVLDRGRTEEYAARLRRYQRYLSAMRFSLASSIVLLGAAVVFLLVALNINLPIYEEIARQSR